MIRLLRTLVAQTYDIACLLLKTNRPPADPFDLEYRVVELTDANQIMLDENCALRAQLAVTEHDRDYLAWQNETLREQLDTAKEG